MSDDHDLDDVQRHLGRRRPGPRKRKKGRERPKPLFPPRRTIDKAALFSSCKYEPTPPQELVHRAGPHDSGGHRYRVISAGVRTGKTWSAAWEVVAAALAPNGYETEWWCVAPLHSLADRCFGNVCSFFSTHFPEHVVSAKQHDGVLVVRNLAGVESRIYRKSTERGLVGLTGASVDGMVIDEASAVPTEIWESSLSTRLVDRKGWVLATSSPRGTSGWWPRMLRVGLREEDPEVFGVCLPTWSNPRLDPNEILKARERLPAHVFEQEYGGQLVAAAGKVFTPESIEQCATGALRDPEPGACYVAGCDVAVARDYTVLTIAERGGDGLAQVVFVDRFHRLSWEVQIDRVRRALARYNDAPCKVDATGLGEPVVQMMRAAGLQVHGVTFSQRRKVALVRNLQALLERGRVELPERHLVPELHDELEQFEYQDQGGGDYQRMSAPPGSHDDCVIALALCTSYFRAGGGQGRFYRRGTGRRGTVPATAPREAPEVARPGPREVVRYDAPATITGGFVDRRTGEPLREGRRNVHTPRRRTELGRRIGLREA